MDLKNEMITEIAPLVAAGAALHWLHPKTKEPIGLDWGKNPVWTLEQLASTYRPGNNVGIRPGEFSKVGGYYLHIIDFDIRKPEQLPQAKAALLALWPGAMDAPFVISGSGGESRHFYLLSDKPFRKKKLAKSEGFEMVWSEDRQRDVKKRDWEIDLFGSGVQVALPPSIHPDTGKPYVWGREFNFDMLDMGVGPIVSSDQVRTWGVQRDEEADDVEVKPILGLELAEIKKVLSGLPVDDWCEDRDGWVQVGMALHHEFGGSQQGYDLWTQFSQQSDKFDPKDQKAVWKSFRAKPNSVRMATLVKAAQMARFEAMFDDDEDEDLDDDLLGEADAALESDEDDLLGSPKAAPAADDDDLLGDPKPEGDAWVHLLDLSDEGAIKPTLHNVEVLLGNDPRSRGIIKMNAFTQEVVYHGHTGKRSATVRAKKPTKQLSGPAWVLRDPINGDRWSDTKDNALRSLLVTPKTQGGWSVKAAKQDIKDAVDLVAQGNSFHPVQEYLNSLVWDGRKRVDTMFVRHLGTPDTAYARGISRLVMLGGAVRVFEPGHKFDYVAILEGGQGKRKSTFISKLAKHWYSELKGDFHEPQKMVERMQGHWVIELPELQGFTKGEVQDIKAFVSTQSDTVRLAYAARAQDYPRQCIFIGSTNEAEYLRDSTGGRRFWPVECLVETIDTDRFAAEVDQLWAETMVAYREMRKAQPYGDLPLYLSDEEAHEEARRLQESRRVETAVDSKAGKIAAWLDTPMRGQLDDDMDVDAGPVLRTETCLTQIWVECLGNDERHYDSRAAQMLGQAVKQVKGWGNVGLRNHEKYGRQRTYVRMAALRQK